MRNSVLKIVTSLFSHLQKEYSREVREMANSDDSEPPRKRTKCSKKFVRFILPNQSPDDSSLVADEGAVLDESLLNSTPVQWSSPLAETADDEPGPSTSSPPDIEIILASTSAKNHEESDRQPQSLLLSKLGQGDILVKIFDLVTSPAEKVRLERVCRFVRCSFHQQIYIYS